MDKKCCIMCNKPIVKIGLARKNGKQHKDWDTRKLHKKCLTDYWRVLNTQLLFDNI